MEFAKKYGKNPIAIFDRLSNGERFRWMSDETYLKLKFRGRLGYKLNLDNPETYTEFIQWQKMNLRGEIYNTMVDKYKAKGYVANIIGEEHIIPTLGVWKNFDEIDFSSLLDQFVLKCTHDSGGLIICRDKNSLDYNVARKKITDCLQRNFFYYGREWAYKDVPPMVIAEEYMEDEYKEDPNTHSLTDYKFLCANGRPLNVMVCTARGTLTQQHAKYFFFDKNWKFLKYQYGHDQLPDSFSVNIPKHINEMFDIAATLSQGIPLVRVDLYEAKDTVYFGEITLYPDSGFDIDITYETDVMLGKNFSTI